MGNSVKTDKEIQLDLGLVGSLSKVGLLGPLRSGPYSGPESRDMIWFQIRHLKESKSEVRFRVRVTVQELLAFEKIKQMDIQNKEQGQI